MRPLVLASASPRRRQLLAQLGLRFRVCDSAVDESILLAGSGDPGRLTQALALAKAEAVAREEADAIVLAADTVVVIDDELLGKPHDTAEAAAMLGRLQGRTHRVVTGVALIDGSSGRREMAAEETLVTMRPLSRREIEAYVASGEPMDKAGAYAIQGLGATLVTRVEGCFYNVVGLPLMRVTSMLKEFGIDVLLTGRAG